MNIQSLTYDTLPFHGECNAYASTWIKTHIDGELADMIPVSINQDGSFQIEDGPYILGDMLNIDDYDQYHATVNSIVGKMVVDAVAGKMNGAMHYENELFIEWQFVSADNNGIED